MKAEAITDIKVGDTIRCGYGLGGGTVMQIAMSPDSANFHRNYLPEEAFPMVKYKSSRTGVPFWATHKVIEEHIPVGGPRGVNE